MAVSDSLYIDISRINVAHEYILNDTNKCKYPDGRKYYGIIYCIEGCAKYRFSSGESCILNEGDVILLLPSASYSIITENEFKHYTINFEIHRKSSDIKFFSKPYYLLRTENAKLYYHIFKKAVSEWTSKKSCYEMRAVACLYELFSALFPEILEKEYNTTSHLRLKPAREYIEQNYNSAFTLDMLANLTNMSITNFRREWLKMYGLSAFQYRDRIRLSYAKDYLSSGYYTVTEVAEKCGFEDTNYFIRFFKKHTGTTPGRFDNN